MYSVQQPKIFMKTRIKLNMVWFYIYAMLIGIKFKSIIIQSIKNIFFSRSISPSHQHGPIFGVLTLSSLYVTCLFKRELLHEILTVKV